MKRLDKVWLCMVLVPTWVAIASFCYAQSRPRFYSPYSEAEILEAVPYVAGIIVAGGTNRHVEKLGIEAITSDKSVAASCGISATACTLYGQIIVISASASKRTLYHELSHIRDVQIEGRTWEDSANHLGWQPSARLRF